MTIAFLVVDEKRDGNRALVTHDDLQILIETRWVLGKVQQDLRLIDVIALQAAVLRIELLNRAQGFLERKPCTRPRTEPQHGPTG